MKTETVPVESLIFDPANARKHGEKNLAAIKGSLQRFGQQKPIVVDAKGIVRAGNGTLAALIALGWKEAVIVRSSLAGSEATAYAIADNRTAELAEWDEDVLSQTLAALQIEDEDLAEATGYDGKEIDALLAPEVIEDEVPEPPADPITKTGDLWLLGEHRVLCGDSTKREDVARLMCGEFADCAFTSPPYGVGLDYGATYDDSIENIRKMLPKIALVLIDHISAGGFAVVNFGDIASGRDAANELLPCEYPMALEYWHAFRSSGWRLWSRRVWCKPTPRVNSMHCIQSNRAATDFEHIWTWTVGSRQIMSRVDGEMRSQNGWCDTTRMHGVDTAKEVHGAAMSTGIAVWMLNIHSRIAHIVIDPFCGTGTTLIAAEQLKRKCYGMEISPAYCDVIVKRWETLTGKKATLATT